MREIKFRGRSLRTGEWVYGDLVQKGNDGLRIVESLYHVDGGEYNCTETSIDPKTVGQYTGLKDKNGVEIYEGDIVIGVGDWAFEMKWTEGKTEPFSFAYYDLSKDYEVIGNIDENKELLDN